MEEVDCRDCCLRTAFEQEVRQERTEDRNPKLLSYEKGEKQEPPESLPFY
jgi:hypothetical protein